MANYTCRTVGTDREEVIHVDPTREVIRIFVRGHKVADGDVVEIKDEIGNCQYYKIVVNAENITVSIEKGD